MLLLLPKGEKLVSLLKQAAPELVRPTACWQNDDGAWVVSISDSKSKNYLKEMGAVPVARPRCTPTRGATDWLELVDLVAVPLPDPWDVSTLLVVQERAVALALANQILGLGHAGFEVGRLGNQADSPYLIKGEGLPLFVIMGQIGAPGVSVFLDSSRRGIWVPADRSHPLTDRIDVPAGHWILVIPGEPWKMLIRPDMRNADTQVRFDLEAVERVAGAPWVEPIRISLRLAVSEYVAEAHAWLSYEEERSELDRWISEVRPQELAAYHFAVLDMNESVVMLRLRPGPDSMRASRPPAGLALGVLPGLEGVYLPCDRKIVPAVGMALLRKAIDAKPGTVRILLPDGEGGAFRIISVPDGEGDFQLLTDWVNYVIERDAELISIWKGKQEFDFDSILREYQAPPVVVAGARKITTTPKLEQDVTPVPIAPAKVPQVPRAAKVPAAKVESAGKGSAGTSDIVIDAPPPSKPGVVPSIDHVALRCRREALVEAFWSERDPLYSDRRCGLMGELSCLELELGNAAEAARLRAVVAWCSPSPVSLDEWFRAEHISNGGSPVAEIEGQVLSVDWSRTPGREWAVWMAAQTSAHPSEAVMDYLRDACRANVWPLRHSWWCAHSLSRCAGGDTLLLAEIRDRMVRRLAGDLRLTGDLPQLLVDRMGQLGVTSGTFPFRLIREVVTTFLEGLEQGTTGLGMPDDIRWLIVSLGYAAQAVGLSLAGDGLADKTMAQSVEAWERISQKSSQAIVVAAGAVRNAYAFRFDQSKGQLTVRGALPQELAPKCRPAVAPAANYIYQSFRELSRLLEPDQRIDRFAVIMKNESAALLRLRAASELGAASLEFDACMEELNGLPPTGSHYCFLLLALLEHAVVLDEGRALQSLNALDRLLQTPQAFASVGGIEKWQTLSTAIRLVCQWNLPIDKLMQHAQSEMVALAGKGSFVAISGFLGHITRRMLACGRGDSLRELVHVLAVNRNSSAESRAVPIDRERSQLAVEAYIEAVHLALGLNPSPSYWDRLMAMDSMRSPNDFSGRMATIGLLDAVVSLGSLGDEKQSQLCDGLCLNLLKSLAGEANPGGTQLIPGCVAGTIGGIEALVAPSGMMSISMKDAWILDETEASLRARVFREYADALEGGREL